MYFYSSTGRSATVAGQVTAPDAVASMGHASFCTRSSRTEIVRARTVRRRARARWLDLRVGAGETVGCGMRWVGGSTSLFDCMIIQCRKLSFATDKWPRLPHHQHVTGAPHQENTTGAWPTH